MKIITARRSSFVLGCFALLLSFCLAVSPAAAGELTPGFELAEGTLVAEFGFDKASEQLVVKLDNSFEGIVGLILHAPQQDRDLIRLSASKAAETLKEALHPRAATASLVIEGDELSGSFETRLPGSLEGIDQLQILLVNHDAQIQAVDLYSQKWIGQVFTVDGLPDEDVQCKKITLECTGDDGTTCSTSTTCCGNLSVCADCNACEITCPPCVRLPNGDSP